MDIITKLLFPPFSREVGGGYPFREPVNSESEFDRWLAEHNGRTDCFVSVYDNNAEIDKIFYDFDLKHPRELEYPKRLGSFLEHFEIDYIPMVSGKKGIHIHPLLKSKTYMQTRKKLIRGTFWLLDMAGVFRIIEKNGYRYKVPLCDTTTAGDLRQLCRIPNTLRPPENASYCTFLPPKTWLKMSYSEIVKHSKDTHVYEYDLNPWLTLDQIQNVDLSRFRPENTVKTSLQTTIPNDIQTYLECILRPCILEYVSCKDPDHRIRTALVADLLELGFPDDEIQNLVSKLGWSDYDSSTTTYHIRKIRKKELHWFSCSRLQELGYCVGC